ncbi:hypothetical protein Zmor_018177 [Zophobas morio]|uniref:THAP domain-containing protein 9 n=1 Tax=Zophobas morio TaxID=2755281 RepID=A0AA38MDL5_9CUCU|nr:hypothetical protein Zmor_018177 [Zophobas morio]
MVVRSITSQLRNVEKKPSAKRWTEQDKIFALSLYKRSPKLYRYLSVYFQVPSTRTLKTILSNIPLDTGINKPLLDHLKNVCQTMNKLDKCCSLIFDEISLSSGFFYDANKDKAFGYEDLGHLGRTSRHANHALVFMLRGMRKTWKQVVAYYLTSATISVANLKNIITLIINQTLEAGFNVMATVCDQGSTNPAALNELYWENSSRFQFKVNGHDIACIFDVPHLLKNTRNALYTCDFIFDGDKRAKFEHIVQLYEIDKHKEIPSLYKLKDEHFNINDSYMKMRVNIAAWMLSNTVGAGLETYAETNGQGLLPPEAKNTAIFVRNMDQLFNSLNGYTLNPDAGKTYRTVLRDNSPHWELG